MKKLAAELAKGWLPRKHARTTTGSDVQVAGFLLRAAGGSGTPNLLATYRKARQVVSGFVWDLFPESIKPFGVVAIDQDNGRLVVTMDAEFLFRLFNEVGVPRLETLWIKTDHPKVKS